MEGSGHGPATPADGIRDWVERARYEEGADLRELLDLADGLEFEAERREAGLRALAATADHVEGIADSVSLGASPTVLDLLADSLRDEAEWVRRVVGVIGHVW